MSLGQIYREAGHTDDGNEFQTLPLPRAACVFRINCPSYKGTGHISLILIHFSILKFESPYVTSLFQCEVLECAQGCLGQDRGTAAIPFFPPGPTPQNTW